MSEDKSTPLSSPPEAVVEVLKAAKSADAAVPRLTDRLDLSKGTVQNRLRDLKTLGLITVEEEEIAFVDDGTVSRVCQVDDLEPLKEAFESLSYAERLLEEVDQEGLALERLGKLVTFHSASNATSEGARQTYGQMFARWADYLGAATYDSQGGKIYPPGHEVSHQGSTQTLKATRNEVFDLLRILKESFDSRGEIAERLSISESTVDRRLSTAYVLRLAEKTRTGYQTTDAGSEFLSKSVGRKKQYIRNRLLELPLCQAVLFYVNEGNNGGVMEKISNHYSKGWSASYRKTLLTRVVNWAEYADLLARDGGKLKLTKKGKEADIDLPQTL